MSEQIKTHWRRAINYAYLGAYSLDELGIREKVVTIKNVKQREVAGERGKEQKLTIDFAEFNKPLICNSTNAKAIAKATKSDYIEDWKGKQVTLYIEHGKWFGEYGDALRIKKAAPAPKQKEEMTPQHRRWGQAVQALKSGKLITDIEAQYFLNPENRERLISEGMA